MQSTKCPRCGATIVGSMPNCLVCGADLPTCSNCGTLLSPDTKFCPSCCVAVPEAQPPMAAPPEATPRFCASCGAEAPADGRFCNHCGQPMDGAMLQAQPVREPQPAEKPPPVRLGWGAKLGVVIMWALLFGLAWGGAMFGFGLVEVELLKANGRPSPLFAFFPMSAQEDLLTMALLHAVPGFGVGAIAAVASGSSTKWSAHAFKVRHMFGLAIYYSVALAGMSLVVSHGIDEVIRRGATIGTALDFYGILHALIWILVSFAGGLRFGLRARRWNPDLGIGGVTTIAFGWAGAAFLGFLNLPYITFTF